MRIILAVVLLLAIHEAGPAAAARGKESKLPSCDDAGKLYKQEKLYEVLGLPKTASQKDIRRNFKKMSVQCHPDKDQDNPNAEGNFIAITGAYQTLSDEQEKHLYDSGRRTARNPRDVNVDDVFRTFFSQESAHRGRSTGSNTFTFSFGGDSGDGGDDGMFEQLFKGFSFGGFGGSAPGARRQKPGPGRSFSMFETDAEGLHFGMPGGFGFGSRSGGFQQAPPRQQQQQQQQPQQQQQQQNHRQQHPRQPGARSKFPPPPGHRQQAPKDDGEVDTNPLDTLLKFYMAVSPGTKSKSSLRELLNKYHGRIGELYDKLEAKYGVSPRNYIAPKRKPASSTSSSSSSSAGSQDRSTGQKAEELAARLRRFYDRVAPGSKSVQELANLARKYHSRPEELYTKLKAKYHQDPLSF